MTFNTRLAKAEVPSQDRAGTDAALRHPTDDQGPHGLGAVRSGYGGWIPAYGAPDWRHRKSVWVNGGQRGATRPGAKTAS